MRSNKIKSVYDRVEIAVSGSTANLGPLFDIAGGALKKPGMIVRLEPADGPGIELVYKSISPTPSGRRRGYAGRRALVAYLNDLGVRQGLRLIYIEDKDGFPTGGTGLSGSESAGAVVAGAILFDQVLTPEQAILAAAKGEPGGHMDNVAPSVLGGFVVVSRTQDGRSIFRKVKPPRNLGFAIGYSSHQKTGGTEGARNVLEDPLSKDLFIAQTQLVAEEISALGLKDVNSFLRVVWRDEFHESRRADAGLYGDFSAEEFRQLKKRLYKKYGIGLAVSGAGPSMGFWYDKSKYPSGITHEILKIIKTWFKSHGIEMRVENVGLAANGVYDYAVRNYPESALARSSKKA